MDELQKDQVYLTELAEFFVPPRLRSKVEPGDVVQEAMLRLHRRGNPHLGLSDPERRLYLKVVLRTTLADQLRGLNRAKRRVDRELSLSSRRDCDQGSLEETITADDTSPTQQAMRRERMERLVGNLARLPLNQQRAVALHHIDGLSLQETAERMGLSRAAVAGLLRRGLLTLRSRLEEGKGCLP